MAIPPYWNWLWDVFERGADYARPGEQASCCAAERRAAPTLSARGGDRELRVEEIRGRLVGTHPGCVAQEGVNLVRQHELLVLDTVLAQRLRQAHRFRERNVVIVVALDEEY